MVNVIDLVLLSYPCKIKLCYPMSDSVTRHFCWVLLLYIVLLLVMLQSLLISVLQVFHHERRLSQLDAVNEMPLYPTEQIVWDENIVPGEYYSGSSCLALPKLNLQFLTLHDYLLRNFHLFRLESTCKYKHITTELLVTNY